MEKFLDAIGRRKYICRSDITKINLIKMGLGQISVSNALEVFDSLKVDEKNVVIFLTGSMKDKKRQKHTKFVNKFYFYKKMIDG